MNCCDYDCNQGPDCPARASGESCQHQSTRKDTAPLPTAPLAAGMYPDDIEDPLRRITNYINRSAGQHVRAMRKAWAKSSTNQTTP